MRSGSPIFWDCTKITWIHTQKLDYSNATGYNFTIWNIVFCLFCNFVIFEFLFVDLWVLHTLGYWHYGFFGADLFLLTFCPVIIPAAIIHTMRLCKTTHPIYRTTYYAHDNFRLTFKSQELLNYSILANITENQFLFYYYQDMVDNLRSTIFKNILGRLDVIFSLRWTVGHRFRSNFGRAFVNRKKVSSQNFS